MPCIFVFTAGILIGKYWTALKNSLASCAGKAAAEFDALYSQMAQKVGQQFEDFEDRIAEKRCRDREHRLRSKGS